MKKRILFLSITALLFASSVSATSVGAVPGSINFGDIEPGETVEQQIYIRTNNVNQNFTVEPTAASARQSQLFSSNFESRDSVSEQDLDDWIELEEATIDPLTQIENPDIPMSNPPRVNGEFTFTINVPSDAEPGYRRGTVRLNPDLTGDGDGAGAEVIGETRLSYTFNVPGNAERDIAVQDVRSFRLGEDEASVELLLNNRGTVTTSTQSFDVDILDGSGSSKATLSASSAYLEPGESQWVYASWSEDDSIEEGSYQVDGEVDYFTGSAYASGSFSLPDFDVVEVVPSDSPQSDGDERGGLPVWLVFMILAILTVLMWSFDIEPFWILAIIGGLAVASFILLSGVSNYLLVVLLMVTGILFYGVM